ncbi:hypothetical protein SHELI_v1c10150 [Spiroplasma helicoides]|uniref:Uncharacterized protein n=1 Tax=Spiroplasma helicoides TaxID=216938 RepID=A0A1B3SM07_9MOLU|nr:hypothetical protein [Spiroplasma helicoides]AOG60962.1 hypothetical protein SHELI_v1c10150 [Spiroplasma helicoides]
MEPPNNTKTAVQRLVLGKIKTLFSINIKKDVDYEYVCGKKAYFDHGYTYQYELVVKNYSKCLYGGAIIFIALPNNPI